MIYWLYKRLAATIDNKQKGLRMFKEYVIKYQANSTGEKTKFTCFATSKVKALILLVEAHDVYRVSSVKKVKKVK